MRKEESTCGVMWVSVSVSELVMHSVVSNPSDDWFLTRHRLQKKQCELEERFRSISSMCEESMRSNSCSKANRDQHDKLDDVS